ncbi:hypothetical protein BCR34DRAFT_608440 [Clohesyomyces aquaticus]|uniref:NAD-dependent epimerase/dehydratase domain-containing protein n=1 Tax=Clohesyomyces aquaticus TaxID=1231657 RepID=A0A1Y1Y7E5_9PLEO|nr:hypothetical protein BCR34DRAFT_608440 [Clohesyomyces aquaticus]
MPPNILITGGSGYLGGTLLAHMHTLPHGSYTTLYALVRTSSQAESVAKYGATPLTLDLSSPASIKETIIANQISIIFHLINPVDTENTVHMIKALAEVKKANGNEVHFLFTTGAKLFSSHAGAPTDGPLYDTDEKMYEIQQGQVSSAPHPFAALGVQANSLVVSTGKKFSVRTYVFAPCIVYGQGEGFGNKISIQTVAIVQAAKALRRVYSIDEGRPTWPVCHVRDNTTLYLRILESILESKEIGYGENGYFLASSGSVAWMDLYEAIANSMKKRDLIGDEKVVKANDATLQRIGDALGCPKDFAPVQIGGLCTFTAKHGQQIGWKPQFAPEHIIETADEEVELILKHSKF